MIVYWNLQQKHTNEDIWLPQVPLSDLSPLSYGFMTFIQTFFNNGKINLILAKLSMPSFIANKKYLIFAKFLR